MKLAFWSEIRFSPFIISLRKIVPNKLVNLFKHLPTAVLANLVYGFPAKNLTVIGITGTDGKTTCATYLHHLLAKAGQKTALISTVKAKIGLKEIDTGFHVTSPDHFLIQKLLRRIAGEGIKLVILEVTSHGLAQHRLWGINFTGGVVTNITLDHLDYHGTWSDYLKAKAKLFKKTRFAVLNQEDKSYRYLLPLVSGKVITYGLAKGKINLSKIELKLPDLSDFNQLNLLAAIAAARALGVKKSQLERALADLPQIKGRLEVIKEKPFKIIVDFAHTPNALNEVLVFLRRQVGSKGRLIAVFGCAGERDRCRRKMGKISAQLADISLITAEDPRTEGVAKISSEIARWARKGGAEEIKASELGKGRRRVFARIDDRAEAIATAIKIARKGDVVGIFGKGHEKSMCYGTKEYPWSDQDEVRKLLNSEGKK